MEKGSPMEGEGVRTRSWGRLAWFWRSAALVLVASHAVFLLIQVEPAVSSPDAHGYLLQAQLIADYGRTWFTPESPLQYVGVHWLKTDDGRYFSRYPPGLPIMMAALFKLGGPDAALLFNRMLASLALLGIFLLCGFWVGKGWGLAATAVMAVNPVANAFALNGDAHTATAFFLVWGLYLLARWAGSFSPRLALAAGFCFGVIPTIRYPEALFGVAAGLYMVLYLGSGRPVWKSLLAAVLGALIPLVPLLVRNALAFGAFWKTGYSLSHEQTGFALEYARRNMVPYLMNMQSEGAGLFIALGVLGMALVGTHRETWRQGMLMAVLILPVTLLYMAYYFAPSGSGSATMRFLLPTFFVYVAAGLWGLKILADMRPGAGYTAAIIAVAFTMCWGLPQSINALVQRAPANAMVAAVSRAVAEHVTPGSVVIADMQIQQNLDLLGQWKLLDESLLQDRPGMNMFPGMAPEPDAPSPVQTSKVEERQRLMERYRNADGNGPSAQFFDDLDAWVGPAEKVYWVGALNRIERLAGNPDGFRVVAIIPVPPRAGAVPGDRGRFRAMPRPMPPGGMPGLGGLLGGGDTRFRRPGGIGMADGPPEMRELVVVEWSLAPVENSPPSRQQLP